MASKVQICNFALTKVGAQQIISIDDNSKNARLCKQYYEVAVDEVLRDHPWNCAIWRVEIAADATAPEFDYVYRYALPSNPWCLRVLDLYPDDIQYVIEGRYILTNYSTCKLKFIGRITDPSQFDSLCANAVYLWLAIKLAYPLMQSRTLVDQLQDEYRYLIRRAKNVDACEDSIKTMDAVGWISHR